MANLVHYPQNFSKSQLILFQKISIGIEWEKLNKKELKFLKLNNSSFKDFFTRKNQKMKIIKIIIIMFIATRVSVAFPFQRQLPKSKTEFIFYRVFIFSENIMWRTSSMTTTVTLCIESIHNNDDANSVNYWTPLDQRACYSD